MAEGIKMNIKIYDDTIRDGEQQVGVFFTTTQKDRLAEAFKEVGIQEIVLMSGVHEVEDGLIKKLAQKNIPITPLSMLDERYVDLAVENNVKRIMLVYGVSDILLNSRGVSREEILERSIDVAKYARSCGLYVDFAGEDSTRADFSYLSQLGRYLQSFIDYFFICDTIGVLKPEESGDFVRRFIGETGNRVGLHYHNDLGLATENTIQGVLSGAEIISGTFTGIGERAGNISIENVLLRLRAEHGIVAENIDYNGIPEVVALVRDFSRMGPAKPFSEEAQYVESGLHVNGLLKDPRTYNPFPKKPPILFFGKQSGASNFQYLFERILEDPQPKERYLEMRDVIKDMSITQRRSFSTKEVREMYENGLL
jgi:isopropylmalate/homocitrate/citramalate synthase